MVVSHREPDVITCITAVSTCKSVGQWQAELELLCSMAESCGEPNAVTCSAVVSARDRGGQWQAALGLLHSAA
eukprot:15090071-Alexandrium_andersonii.AAC.1